MIANEQKGSAEVVNATSVISTTANTITVRESVVSVFPARPVDATPVQTLKLIEQSGTLEFWQDAEEDIYTLEDGMEI